MTHERFVTAITGLATTFGRELPAIGLDGYWHVMRGLSEQQLGVATTRALRESKFMPSPAELLAFAGVTTSRDAQVALAWEAVRAAVDKHDYTASVDFGPLVNAVVRNIGGWDALCRAKLKELDVWLRRRFEEVHEMFADIPVERLNGAPLRGWMGGKPVRISIGGVDPVKPLEPAREVRRLAEAKSR
jgi:hypothetical protein